VKRVAVALLLASCAHSPAAPADVVPGQLVVGTAEASSPEGVLRAVELPGFRFEYAAAASTTSHLVRVTKADGSALTAEETSAVQRALSGAPALSFVELNRVRTPR
jgi:hypothetical protein